VARSEATSRRLLVLEPCSIREERRDSEERSDELKVFFLQWRKAVHYYRFASAAPPVLRSSLHLTSASLTFVVMDFPASSGTKGHREGKKPPAPSSGGMTAESPLPVLKGNSEVSSEVGTMSKATMLPGAWAIFVVDVDRERKAGFSVENERADRTSINNTIAVVVFM
jgi:hypothetical protein